MKITIDTISKTIKVEEAVNLNELFEQLDFILPNWKEYSLLPMISYIGYPVIEPTPIYPTPIYPSYPTWSYDRWVITCEVSGEVLSKSLLTN